MSGKRVVHDVVDRLYDQININFRVW